MYTSTTCEEIGTARAKRASSLWIAEFSKTSVVDSVTLFTEWSRTYRKGRPETLWETPRSDKLVLEGATVSPAMNHEANSATRMSLESPTHRNRGMLSKTSPINHMPWSHSERLETSSRLAAPMKILVKHKNRSCRGLPLGFKSSKNRQFKSFSALHLWLKHASVRKNGRGGT